MTPEQLVERLQNAPDAIEFSQVMAVIDAHYDYRPSRFSNGETVSEAGTNEGSCKIFAFAQLNGLDEQQTLACFGEYYRNDVLKNPQGTDHANIRNFLRSGVAGLHFDQPPLTKTTD